MHLLEADDSLTQRSWWSTRARVALCGAELTEDTAVPDFDGECPGCVDCIRYCRRCVGVAVGFCEPEQPAEVYVGWLQAPDHLMSGRLVADSGLAGG